MKQGSLDVDRLKSEGRHCFHRRKMLKNSPLLNGDSENMDRTIARELNYAVAAAFHDHLSCTKSSPPDFCSIDNVPKEIRTNNLPIETDHIYANSNEIRNKSNTIITNSPSTPQETPSNELPISFDRNRRMCLLRKRLSKAPLENEKSNISEPQNEPKLNLNYSPCNPPTGSQHTSLKTPILATRYFGRRSKTIPSRALKRRYLGPPKILPIRKELNTSIQPSPVLTKTISVSEANISDSIKQELQQINNSSPLPTKVHKKRGRKPKKSVKPDYLTTESEYFLPDNPTSPLSPTPSQIDVPLWKFKPVTSFYQMEGTENINEPVFQRRHMKCELDERRRKRWDMQRLREQKASQKLKYKNSSETGKGGFNNIHKKSRSFYSDPRKIEYIEVTDILPVTAFGSTIPVFKSSEFSLPWLSDQNQSSSMSENNSINNRNRKGRPTSQGTKVT